MNEKPYRIVDDSSLSALSVHIYDPAGEDITAEVFEYIITRTVTEGPRVRLSVRAEPRIVNGELNKHWIEGPVVCEITATKSVGSE